MCSQNLFSYTIFFTNVLEKTHFPTLNALISSFNCAEKIKITKSILKAAQRFAAIADFAVLQEGLRAQY